MEQVCHHGVKGGCGGAGRRRPAASRASSPRRSKVSEVRWSLPRGTSPKSTRRDLPPVAVTPPCAACCVLALCPGQSIVHVALLAAASAIPPAPRVSGRDRSAPFRRGDLRRGLALGAAHGGHTTARARRSPKRVISRCSQGWNGRPVCSWGHTPRVNVGFCTRGSG